MFNHAGDSRGNQTRRRIAPSCEANVNRSPDPREATRFTVESWDVRRTDNLMQEIERLAAFSSRTLYADIRSGCPQRHGSYGTVTRVGDNCGDEHAQRFLPPSRRFSRWCESCEHASGLDCASLGDRSTGGQFVSRRRARGDPDAGEPLVRSCVWDAARSLHALTLRVKDHGYKSGNHTIVIEPGGGRTLVMALGQSHHWYDFSVGIAGADRFLRRFAGRVETGKSGFSDPMTGRVGVPSKTDRA